MTTITDEHQLHTTQVLSTRKTWMIEWGNNVFEEITRTVSVPTDNPGTLKKWQEAYSEQGPFFLQP